MAGFPCFLWLIGASPWAASASESAVTLLKLRLDATHLVLLLNGVTLVGMISLRLPLCFRDHPNVWSDGSLVLDQVTGVSCSGAGFFAHQSVGFWNDRR